MEDRNTYITALAILAKLREIYVKAPNQILGGIKPRLEVTGLNHVNAVPVSAI